MENQRTIKGTAFPMRAFTAREALIEALEELYREGTMSPTGFEGVRMAAADIEARKNSGGSGSKTYFKLPKSGDSAVVRFGEQGSDIHWAWVHQVPPRGNQKWGDDVPCLDQQKDGTPCPGCELGLEKTFLGVINLIWRDGPKFGTRDDGSPDFSNIVGKTDVVAVWERGIQTFEELDGMDVTYKGLMSRDFRITRRGLGMDTKYKIVPADPDGGPSPLSEADEKLLEGKYDLNPDVTPPSYETMRGYLNQQGNGGQQTNDASAFMGGQVKSPFA